MVKKWQIIQKVEGKTEKRNVEDVIHILLENRGLKTNNEIDGFLHPTHPDKLTASDVGIDPKSLRTAIERIQKAIENKESIVVYADYDADGITAGAVMWEAIAGLGGRIMPYIPHRTDEGYGLSKKGIDSVIKDYNPTLLITVDHGITGGEYVEYAKSKGIDVIVTDHHMIPKDKPECTTVHTTLLCGAGISWFVSKELMKTMNNERSTMNESDLLALATIGTVADMMPLTGINRSLVKYGIEEIRKTTRVGLIALMKDAGLEQSAIGTYDISHILAPRLNAMGRLVHAMDALRLLCTRREDKAMELARTLSLTNIERQKLTADSTSHAFQGLTSEIQGKRLKKLLFVSHDSYNPGIIGLVAGKLVEEYYRPAVVVARGKVISKASARSIKGFNIVEVIRTCSDLLIDVGGHPMAAGFTFETKNISKLQKRLEDIADKDIDEDMLMRSIRIDAEIPLELATTFLWSGMQQFGPLGFGNPEPIFSSNNVSVDDIRLIGKDNKHLKLRFRDHNIVLDAVAFNLGSLYGTFKPDHPVDIAYSIDMNVWNGNRKLQLKIKDVHFDTE